MGRAGSFGFLPAFVSALLFSTSVLASPANGLQRRQYDAEEITVDDAKHNEEFFNFVTRPDIDAPRWNITTHDKDALAPGYWFTAFYGIVEQTNNDKAYAGPHMYDSNGELIWSGAPFTNNYASFDVRINQMKGEPVITFITPEFGSVFVLDSSYQKKKVIHIGDELASPDDKINKKSINIHDFTMYDDSYTILTRTRANITKARMEELGHDGSCTIEYPGFMEADMETDEVLFDWNPRPHIALEESYVIPKKCEESGGWDYIHLNSVDKFPDGDFLVSARHTYALYKISHKDGSVVWRLNGKKSDFEWLDGSREFMGQHDARFVEQNETHILLSVLDNAVAPGIPNMNNPFSRGVLMALHTDVNPMTVEVLAEYDQPDERHAFGRGNLQFLPNGNAFLGWSTEAAHSEHSVDGKLLMEAKIPCGLKSYRNYKFPWVGRPKEVPTAKSQAIDLDGTVHTTVHVSWNGATEVATWNLYKSTRDGDAKEMIASRQRDGFETVLTYRGYSSYVVAEAVDVHGQSLSMSNVTKTTEPSNPDAPEVVADAAWQSSQFEIKAAKSHGLSNPLIAFISGVAFCAAAMVSGFAFWYVRRNGVPSLGRYQILSHGSDYTDEEEPSSSKASYDRQERDIELSDEKRRVIQYTVKEIEPYQD